MDPNIKLKGVRIFLEAKDGQMPVVDRLEQPVFKRLRTGIRNDQEEGLVPLPTQPPQPPAKKINLIRVFRINVLRSYDVTCYHTKSLSSQSRQGAAHTYDEANKNLTNSNSILPQ
ncbi:hypothetical protein J6590_082277 [Homalodisca vitripennis]|nr:hypothetical protein J6590_082277 [Homalodisca vitripennis]